MSGGRHMGASAILYGLGALAAAGAARGTVTAAIDPPSIYELETTQLTLRADDADQPMDIDTAPLQDAFEVLRVNTTTQFRAVNGQVQRWVEYQIELRPKRSGALEVPPLNVHGQPSPALTLQVLPLSQDIRDEIDALMFFEVAASPNPVRVQAQTVLTRRLFYASGMRVYSDLPGAPEVPNALIMPLGEESNSNTQRDGVNYGVLEQRYAIFPERSGQLRIPEASVVSAVRLQAPGRNRQSGIRVRAPEVLIEVLPVPANYPQNEPWLPAQRLTIQETWDPPNPEFNVGEPLRRTVTVQVVGNTGAAIPPLALDLPGAHFKQYPEPERLRDEQDGGQILGERQEIHSIIPIEPGEAVVPGLTLTWWDTANERVMEAMLPERRVRILGEAPVPAPATVTAQEGGQLQPDGDMAPITQTAYPAWLMALAAIGFIGWAATWLALGRGRANKPHPATSSAGAKMRPKVRQCWRDLQDACRREHGEAMRNAWLAYLGARWRASAPDALRRINANAEAKALLHQLNQALYAKVPATGISGPELLQRTRALMGQEQAPAPSPLPPLHDFNRAPQPS